MVVKNYLKTWNCDLIQLLYEKRTSIPIVLYILLISQKDITIQAHTPTPTQKISSGHNYYRKLYTEY